MRSNTAHNGLRTLNQVLSTNPVMGLLAKLASLVAFVVVLATAYQIITDIQERKQERADQAAERVLRAFETLARSTGTDIGKGEAISIIFRERGSLDGLRIGCGEPNPTAEFCSSPTKISGLHVEGKPLVEKGILKNFPSTTIMNTVVEDTVFTSPNISRLQWFGLFKNVGFVRGTIEQARISGHFSSVSFVGMRLRNSVVFNVQPLSEEFDGHIEPASEDTPDDTFLVPELSVIASDITGTLFITPPRLLIVQGSISEAANPPAMRRERESYSLAGVMYCQKIADTSEVEFNEFSIGAVPPAAGQDPGSQPVICSGQMTEAEARAAYPAAWANILSSVD